MMKPSLGEIDMWHYRCLWMRVSLAIVAVMLAGGCGAKGPAKITIHGAVTLDGEPLPEGQVVFIHADPAVGAVGGSIVNGNFTVTTFKGPHTIEVHCMQRRPRPIPPGGRPEDGITEVSIIPPRYNEQTELTFDVQSPEDRPEFALTTLPEKTRRTP
jgi:hypothetical protein